MLFAVVPGVVLAIAGIYYGTLPIAEVIPVKRGTAISAVYGTVRIEPTFIVNVRAQNPGLIRLADEFAAGRGAIGKAVEKNQLLATIADEGTARQLKQAQADLQAARQNAELPLPSQELLKSAADNVHRIEKLAALNNVPAVEFEKAKSEANRLRSVVEAERIERERNLGMLEETCRKLEAQMKTSEIRAPMDGLLTAMQIIEGEVVATGNQLFTVASRKNYVRGEVNEEDVGAIKAGMKAALHMYAYQNQTFSGVVSSVLPAPDPQTQRYTVLIEMENPPDNLMAGMTGEMNIITGKRENVLLAPTRALLVDQVLQIKNGTVRKRTVKTGYRTLDFTEIVGGLTVGDRLVVADHDKLRPGQRVRERKIDSLRSR